MIHFHSRKINKILTCKFRFRKIWDNGWLCLVFFFLLIYYRIFLFVFNFNTTDYFWASVIDLIRKYYIHISWKDEGRGWKGLGYGALPCSFTSPPLIPYFKWGREGLARRAVLQHHHDISHCHNITTRWKVGVTVSRGHPQSPEREGRDQRRRGERERERA